MKAFFSALNRNVGTLLLSLAIAAGLSYYLLSYVPQQTASLNARYFRVLSRIGYNVKEEIKAQHLNDEGDARSVAHLLSYKLAKFWRQLHTGQYQPSHYGPADFVREANQVLADRPGPEKYRIAQTQDTSAYKYSMRLIDNQFRFGYIVPPAPVEGAKRWKGPAPPAKGAGPAAKAGAGIGLPVRAGTSAGAVPTATVNALPKKAALAQADTTYELVHTVPVDTLLRALRRPDVFDYFFVLELPSHRLLYSSAKNDFYLAAPAADKTGKGRLPRWLADSTLAHAGQTGAFPFGGQSYQLFAQPVQLGPRLNCLLVGGVNSHRFDTERRALPAGWPELLVGALLLGVLALPFLKLKLMSPREQISRRDVLLSAASLVLGSGVLLLTLQAAVSNYQTDCLLRNQLASLAEDVARDLHAELTQLNSVVRQIDQALPKPPASPADGAVLTLREGGAASEAYARRRKSYSSRRSANALSEDYLTWIARAGQAQYGLDPAHQPDQAASGEVLDALAEAMDSSYCLPLLKGRRYLQKLNSEEYQLVSSDSCQLQAHVPRKDTCYFDMLRTVRNTSHLRTPSPAYTQDVPHLKAVLARPSKLNSNTICVFETRLTCFDDGIIPPGYGFCLVEPNGEVMAHSDSNLNLSENLLQDCEPNNELAAVLYAQQQQPGKAIEVTYQGKPTMLYVYPLAGMKRYLITFFDMSYAKAQQSQTSLLAVLLLGGFWLLVAAVALLNWLVLRTVRQTSSRDRFQNLWPRPAYAGRYWQVVAGQVLGLGVLGVVARQVGPLGQLVLLGIGPLLLFVLAYHHTRLRGTHRRGIMGWVVGLVSALLLVQLVLHGYLVGGDTAWLAGGAVALGALVVLLLRQRRRARLAQPRASASYRVAYVGMLLGWIVLLAIVPALSCYRVAQVVEGLQQLRAGQLQILKDYEKGEEHLASRDKARVNVFYHSDFFFKSDFDPMASSQRGALSSADLATLQFFTFLRQPMAKAGGEAAKALFVDATPNANWHPWWVTSLAGDSLTLSTQDNANNSQVVSQMEGLQLGWLHAWPHPFWPAAGWWLLAGLWWAVVLGGLWALVSYLLRRLFGLSATAVASPRLLAAPQPEAVARCFWLLPAGSAWADVPAWAKQKLGPPARVLVLDCRQYYTVAAEEWPNVLASLPKLDQGAAATPQLLVLASFDYRLAEAAFTSRKCELLTELQQRGWPLVVLSTSHPEAFGYCGHPLEKPCPDTSPGHRAMREAGERLLDALADFRMEYFALQGTEPVPLPDKPAGLAAVEAALFEDNSRLQRFFERECQAFPFVAGLRRVLLTKLWQQQRTGQPLTRGAIETAVQRLSQFHFRRLWLALTPQEKFLLFDLAQDGLVNTDNALALSILLQKGYLCRADNGRLSLCSASFRGFILTAQRKHEAMQYVAASEQGTWAATQTPLLLLLAAGALFMFITQPTAFTQTQTFLLGLTSLLPALAGLVKFLLVPKPTASDTGH